ncbi:MAG: tetratricopeptide repeat protein [Myxococcales bacterium]|nr:tetratricopeptide repeat protein [Myxococcales bacterium]
MTSRAADLCKSGGDASAALQRLLSAVESEYGADHEAAQLVRLYAGSSDQAQSGGGVVDRPIDPEVGRAFKKLRACAPTSERDELPEITYEQHLSVALRLYERALYRQALEAALLAREHAEAPDTPAERMKLHDLLAKIQLQLGRREEAIREAAAAEQLAAAVGATANRIDYARLYADAGDLEKAEVQLDRLESVVTRPTDRAEYAEARGVLDLLLGSPRDALVQLGIALEGHRISYGADHPSTAAVLQLQGDAYRLAGDFPAAIAAYHETLRLRRAVLGPKHAETARTQNAIGVLQADIGDWENADSAFAAAFDILRHAIDREGVCVRATADPVLGGPVPYLNRCKEVLKFGHDPPVVRPALRFASQIPPIRVAIRHRLRPRRVRASRAGDRSWAGGAFAFESGSTQRWLRLVGVAAQRAAKPRLPLMRCAARRRVRVRRSRGD